MMQIEAMESVHVIGSEEWLTFTSASNFLIVAPYLTI